MAPKNPNILAAPASKIGPVSLDRNVASAPAPVSSGGDIVRADLSTYLTRGVADPEIIYNGDRLWANVTLELKTAGPVVAATRADGKGLELTTNQPQTFRIPKGTRLYVTSPAVSRISVTVEATPWLEQITALIIRMVTSFENALTRKKAG